MNTARSAFAASVSMATATMRRPRGFSPSDAAAGGVRSSTPKSRPKSLWRQPSGVFAQLVLARVFKTRGGWDDRSQRVRFPYTPVFPENGLFL